MAEKICPFDGCGKKVHSVGLCRGHYRQQRRGAPLTAIRPQGHAGINSGGCSFPECLNRAKTSGLCPKHYQQKRCGEALVPIRPTRRLAARDEHGRKQCRGCDAWLPESDFYVAAALSDGLRAICRSCERYQQVQRNYALSRAAFDALLLSQSGACAICQRVEDSGRGMAVDHDHACCPAPGKSCGACVRGILCWNCNVAIGHMDDDPERLRAAATYLSGRAAG